MRQELKLESNTVETSKHFINLNFAEPFFFVHDFCRPSKRICTKKCTDEGEKERVYVSLLRL